MIEIFDDILNELDSFTYDQMISKVERLSWQT